MQKLWFKAKTYGWGWYPSSTEGWLVTIVAVVCIIGLAITTNQKNVLTNTICIWIIVLALIVVAYKTGEKPKWRWGK